MRIFFIITLAVCPFFVPGFFLNAEPVSSQVFQPAGNKTAPEPAFQWKKSYTDDGITIYWSKVEGSRVIAFKGEGIVDAPIEKVASVVINTSRGTEWIDGLLKSRVVRNISPTEFIEYDQMGSPILMADRDFVSYVTIDTDAKTKRVTVTYNPAQDPSAPPSQKNVRGSMICDFKMIPMTLSDETYVEAEIHCDPNGEVPKWLVNFFQQGWPSLTFKHLRKQAMKQDVQVLPLVEKLLKPSVVLAKTPKSKANF